MKEFVISEVQAETAVLVGLITKTQDERKTNEYLDELAFLAETAGAEVVKRFTQKLDAAHSVTYVGKGKLEEIKEYIRNEEEAEREIGMVIFDDELSAKQIRNIEAELKIKILDRTSLILDIFAMRAQTANAKTQVELAQYKYMLPRLQRLWTHLERQGGGSGAGGGKGSVGLRGPGETQLEMDRRIILNRMSLLKERLAEIDKQKSTQRKNRGRMIRAALVGYTNVGKSTLMNVLVGERISIATFKAQTTRHRIMGIYNTDDMQIVFSDTPGVLKPNYKLQESMLNFSTSALADADVLLYVTDVVETPDKHNDFVEKVGHLDVPVLLLINKIDLSNQEKLVELVEAWKELLPKAEIIPISATSKFNVDYVMKRVKELLPDSPPYFDKDQWTDKPARFFVTEIIREKILLYYDKEIPYSVEVMVEQFKEEAKKIHISAVIYVERDSQKGIIIGKQGKALKKVATEARRDLERFFGKTIFLETFVKVDKDWRSSDKELRNFGYQLD